MMTEKQKMDACRNETGGMTLWMASDLDGTHALSISVHKPTHNRPGLTRFQKPVASSDEATGFRSLVDEFHPMLH